MVKLYRKKSSHARNTIFFLEKLIISYFEGGG